MSADRCWIIESRAHAAPTYWRAFDAEGCNAWSGFVDEAIRFARKQDAAEVIRGLGLKLCDAVEHEWVATMPSSTTTCRDCGSMRRDDKTGDTPDGWLCGSCWMRANLDKLPLLDSPVKSWREG